MNPNKKKQAISRVIKAYRQYTLDLLEYNKKVMDLGKSDIGTDQSAEEYYNNQEQNVVPIKPNIRYYLDKYDVKVLKKIIEKKPGYENIKLV